MATNDGDKEARHQGAKWLVEAAARLGAYADYDLLYRASLTAIAGYVLAELAALEADEDES